MKKIKITVLKTTFNEDLAKEYGVEGLSTCPKQKVGDVYYTNLRKPKGFCEGAWKGVSEFVFALAHGADKEPFYFGTWMKEPGVAICSCSDGLRPVIFKIETKDK